MAGAIGAGSSSQRADALLSEWEKRISGLVRRMLAKAVEEAEDIWAEAQSTRRGSRENEPERGP
jgi:hypothetical protein